MRTVRQPHRDTPMGHEISHSNPSDPSDRIMPPLPADGFHRAPVPPRICVGRARALYVGPGLDLAPHLNVATTLVVSREQPFLLRLWSPAKAWSDWRPYWVASIPSATLHHLKAIGPVAFLYLDPVTARLGAWDPERLSQGRERLIGVRTSLGIETAFGAFGIAPASPTDARIARAVLQVDRNPAAFGRISEAAALACLSPSRFRARFDAEIGLPFRRYRLWSRMAVVMRTIASGGSLTEAALTAGFSSSAHLSSAFKRMFGLSPSDVVSLRAEIDLSDDPVLGLDPRAERPLRRAHADASTG